MEDERIEASPGRHEAAAIEAYSAGVAELRRALLRSLSQLLPGVPAFTELWTSLIPTRRMQRQVHFLVALGEAMDRLEGWVAKADERTVDLLEDFLETAETRRGSEKRAYYAAALANSLGPQSPDEAERERMIALLDDLLLTQLRLIAMVDAHLRSDRYVDTAFVPLPGDIDPDNAQRDWEDLVDRGVFAETHRSVTKNLSTGRDHPYGEETVHETEFGVGLVGGRLTFVAEFTDFGHAFARFVDAADAGVEQPPWSSSGRGSQGVAGVAIQGSVGPPRER